MTPHPLACDAADHRWGFATSLPLGIPDVQGWYRMVTIVVCHRCKSAGCEVKERQASGREERLLARGLVLQGSATYTEVEV